jgi:hypothetical protein
LSFQANDLYAQETQEWIARGSHPKEYTMGGDPTLEHGSENSSYIESIVEETNGFGTWMTQIKSGKYLGKRVKLSAYIKTEKVENMASIWMRVDSSTKMLSFDNMVDRPIKGTTDWKKYDIILDVPSNATGVFYGLMIGGKGKARADGLQLEIVDEDAPISGIGMGSIYFEAGEYEKASVLYKRTIESNPGDEHSIYNHIFYYLSIYAAGKKADAQKYIKEYSKSLTNEKWITPVIRYFSGDITEEQLLKAAKHSVIEKEKEQLCEAYYYIGKINLLNGDAVKAKAFFEKCLETNVKTFWEYGFAKAELDRMKKI